MKLLATTMIFLATLSAYAADTDKAAAAPAAGMAWTARIEVRDMATATSSCGTTTPCTGNTNTGFGVGVTTPVWNFAQDWALVTGGMLRQRTVSLSVTGSSPSLTDLDLDIPVAAQWSFGGSFALRAGLDLGFKLSSAYTTYLASAFSDNSTVTPFELGFDWNFLPNQLINLAYESGVTLATGVATGTPSQATGSSINLGYGYTF